jgi:tRNA-2-methylthio-N6-dimethylallyladenosine synthase
MATFHIRTYGCQMNRRDSELLACLLRDRGHLPAASEEQADVILLNTCSVRDQAERKAIGKAGLLKRLKRQRPALVLGVVGCMAEAHGQALLGALPHLDLIAGPDQLHDVPDLVDAALRGRRGTVATGLRQDIPGDMSRHEPGRPFASVAVMRGCDQFCAYCIVPQTRGRERSRPAAEIVEEVRRLAADGTREILLLGQNITAYGIAEARGAGTRDERQSPFADLLRAVHDVPGILRVRFTSPHVRYMNEAFVDAVCSLPKVCQAFHVPVQSGSDRLLGLMRRGYTAAEYLSVVGAIRSRVPRVAFSTDIIVGFPTETEADFQATRDLMQRVGFDMAYIFKYSPRQGTRAAETLLDDVPAEVKLQRNQVLLADLEAGVAERNRSYVGQTVEVLAEGPSLRNAIRWQGRSDTGKVVIFEPGAAMRPGDRLLVCIERATSHALFGRLVS